MEDSLENFIEETLGKYNATPDEWDHYEAVKNTISTDQLLKQIAEALDKAVRSISELISFSRGVDGLHLNGDVAPWDELRTGGRFEEWMIEFDEAQEFLQKYHEQED